MILLCIYPFSPSIILCLNKFSATSLFSNYDFVSFNKNVLTVIDKLRLFPCFGICAVHYIIVHQTFGPFLIIPG